MSYCRPSVFSPTSKGSVSKSLGVAVERGKVCVDKFYRTNVPGIYAIGDIVPGPALAHVASAEGFRCVEAICGLDPAPGGLFDHPAVRVFHAARGGVGRHDRTAGRRAGIAVKIGRFPFTASGKGHGSRRP